MVIRAAARGLVKEWWEKLGVPPTDELEALRADTAHIDERGEGHGRGGRKVKGVPPSMGGLLVLRRLLLAEGAERTLETGVSLGSTTSVFASVARSRGATPSRQHVAIDPFITADTSGAAQLSLEERGLDGYVEFVEEPSELALPQLLREGRVFDLMHIDGQHYFENVVIDAFYGLRLLRRGGVMILDDAATDFVGKAVAFLDTLSTDLERIDLAPFRCSTAISRSAYGWASRVGAAQTVAYRRRTDTLNEERLWHIQLPF